MVLACKKVYVNPVVFLRCYKNKKGWERVLVTPLFSVVEQEQQSQYRNDWNSHRAEFWYRFRLIAFYCKRPYRIFYITPKGIRYIGPNAVVPGTVQVEYEGVFARFERCRPCQYALEGPRTPWGNLIPATYIIQGIAGSPCGTVIHYIDPSTLIRLRFITEEPLA